MLYVADCCNRNDDSKQDAKASDTEQNNNINHPVICTQKNTLDCDQSNYSSRIVFSYISIEFGPTVNSVIGSADPENPAIEPNMHESDDPLWRYHHLNFARWRPSLFLGLI